MTLKQYVKANWTSLRYLAHLWGMPELNLRRYSVAQMKRKCGTEVPSARIPSEATRKKIHDLTDGAVDWYKDWPDYRTTDGQPRSRWAWKTLGKRGPYKKRGTPGEGSAGTTSTGTSSRRKKKATEDPQEHLPVEPGDPGIQGDTPAEVGVSGEKILEKLRVSAETGVSAEKILGKHGVSGEKILEKHGAPLPPTSRTENDVALVIPRDSTFLAPVSNSTRVESGSLAQLPRETPVSPETFERNESSTEILSRKTPKGVRRRNG